MATDVSWTMETEGNGTLSIDAILGDTPQLQRGREFQYRLFLTSRSTYKTVREYLDYAGANQTGTTINGEPWFRQHLPANSSVTSNLVKMVPSSDLNSNNEYISFWGLITDGTDDTPTTPADYEITLRLFIIAEGSYGNRSTVETDFEV